MAKKKTVGAIAAALILAAGGVTAAVMLRHKTSAGTEIFEAGVTKLRLTDQTDSFGLHQLTKSENGFYIMDNWGKQFYEILYEDNGANRGFIHNHPHMQVNCSSVDYLQYADLETGQIVPLCIKPDCMHDGSLYCTASTEVYSYPEPVYYDGWLYSLSTKYNDLNAVNEYGFPDRGEPHQVLLRYAKDGTEINELHDFGEGEGLCRPVMHRGYLWFAVSLVREGEEVENPVTGNKQKFRNGGYEIWGYELKTGKLTMLYSGMPGENIDHVNGTPWYLFGVGDYLYFAAGRDDWSGGGGLQRISLLTGERSSGGKGQYYYGFSDSYMIYYSVIEPYGFHLYNPETGEDTRIPDQENCVPYLDSGYLYMVQMQGKDDTAIPVSLRICDLSFNVLGEVSFSLQPDILLSDAPDGENIVCRTYLEGALDGTLYFKYYINDDDEDTYNSAWQLGYGMAACSIESIINGDPQWEKIYSVMHPEQDTETMEKEDESYETDRERAKEIA